MKKYTLSIVLVSLFAIGLFSCKKDYTCKCSVTVNLLGQTTTSDTTIAITKTTKKDAKTKCEANGNALNAQAQLLDGSASCNL